MILLKKSVNFMSGRELFQYQKDENDLEFRLFIYYRQLESATFLLPDGQSGVLQLNWDSPPRHSRISVCGFQANFIGKAFCFAIDRVGGFKADKKNPEGISFTLNRNAILKSPKSEELNDEITCLVHEGYKCFLKDTNSYSVENIYELNKQSKMHGGNSSGFDPINNLSLMIDKFPELICFKFYKIEFGKNISTCEIYNIHLSRLEY